GRPPLSWFRLRRWGRRMQASADEPLELRAHDPVVAHRLHVLLVGIHLSSPRIEELRQADLHRVVLALAGLDDALTERKQDVALVLQALPNSQEARPCRTHVRADRDRER